MKLNLGCGRHPLPGWTNLDSVALPGVDVVADLTKPLPLPDDGADELAMYHVIEHLANPLPTMQELWRIAKPGAKLFVSCPFGASDDAWEDPTHARPYFLNSFGFFSQPYYWRADYGYRGDWQPEVINLLPFEQLAGVGKGAMLALSASARNVIKEMRVILVAVKPIREPRRELIVNPRIEIAA